MTASHTAALAVPSPGCSEASGLIAPVSASSPTPVAAAPAAARCPRCDRDALYGLECAHCGRVIITGLIGGPRLCPAEERAQATGRPYCPKCYAADAQLYVTGAGDMCGPCAVGLLGRRISDLTPVAETPPA
ncbi:hypothetical protein ACIP93_31705 [Streptomyces sp. NPDC088745]|uniref:hypothetical protein n=1 Tax=Streptomyces sp. NPDC088745 TaxID=3365884 RepID=UPI00381795B3